MKTYLLTLTFFVLTGFTALFGQDTLTIKRDALIHIEALVKKDYNTYANYMHPKIITMSGGREKLISAVKAVMEKSENKGNAMRASTLGAVGKFYHSGKEIFCALPYTIVVNAPGGYATIESSLLGISADQGKTWKFISSGNVPREVIKKAFPGLPAELKIVPKSQPVFHREE